MKIQLDTDNKIIKLENEVLLSKLVETLNKLLPNGEWKKFTLQTNTTITHWHDPIVIERYREPYYYPWYGTLCSNKLDATYQVRQGEGVMSLKSGVFDIEV